MKKQKPPRCPECSAPLFPAFDTGELECRACSDLSRAQPHAGCPYCGANSYYSLAAKNKDEKLEGYKCDSCEKEFSEKELTEWVQFLSAVVDGCGQGTRWGLNSLATSLPPLYIGKIAKDRTDFLEGKKTIPQITDPSHCLDLITPYALGDVTPQRASEVLSKSLLDAYEKHTATTVLKGCTRKQLGNLRDTGPATLNKVRAAAVAGCARQTISNWIKDGKVDPAGSGVDTISLVDYLLRIREK